jgi:hypothetical protein
MIKDLIRGRLTPKVHQSNEYIPQRINKLYSTEDIPPKSKERLNKSTDINRRISSDNNFKINTSGINYSENCIYS